MDLALTESQEMLRTSARSFVEREAPTHTIVALQRETSSLVPALWRKAVDVGWPGILVLLGLTAILTTVLRPHH